MSRVHWAINIGDCSLLEICRSTQKRRGKVWACGSHCIICWAIHEAPVEDWDICFFVQNSVGHGLVRDKLLIADKSLGMILWLIQKSFSYCANFFSVGLISSKKDGFTSPFSSKDTKLVQVSHLVKSSYRPFQFSRFSESELLYHNFDYMMINWVSKEEIVKKSCYFLYSFPEKGARKLVY